MIKSFNKSESNWIAKLLNIRVQYYGSKGYHFTRDGEEFIAVIQIKQASKLITLRAIKSPEISKSFRWVRDTETNKMLLTNYLIKEVIVYSLGWSCRYYFTPCCHSFSITKPTSEQGHKGIVSDCLLLLLGEEEKFEALDYRFKLRERYQLLDKCDFFNMVKWPLLAYVKKRVKLTKLKEFIESLPRRDGCFQFPLIKNKPFRICPGCSPIPNPPEPLEFKVDLVCDDPAINDQIKQPSSKLSQKPKRRLKKLSQKCKIDFLNPKDEKNLIKEVRTSSISSQDLAPSIAFQSGCLNKENQTDKKMTENSTKNASKPEFSQGASFKVHLIRKDANSLPYYFIGNRNSDKGQTGEILAQVELPKDKACSHDQIPSFTSKTHVVFGSKPSNRQRPGVRVGCNTNRPLLGKRGVSRGVQDDSSLLEMLRLFGQKVKKIEGKENRMINANRPGSQKMQNKKNGWQKKEVVELDKKILRNLIGSHRRKRKMKGFLGPD